MNISKHTHMLRPCRVCEGVTECSASHHLLKWRKGPPGWTRASSWKIRSRMLQQPSTKHTCRDRLHQMPTKVNICDQNVKLCLATTGIINEQFTSEKTSGTRCQWRMMEGWGEGEVWRKDSISSHQCQNMVYWLPRDKTRLTHSLTHSLTHTHTHTHTQNGIQQIDGTLTPAMWRGP